jgi:hypothetical protein
MLHAGNAQPTNSSTSAGTVDAASGLRFGADCQSPGCLGVRNHTTVSVTSHPPLGDPGTAVR